MILCLTVRDMPLRRDMLLRNVICPCGADKYTICVGRGLAPAAESQKYILLEKGIAA